MKNILTSNFSEETHDRASLLGKTPSPWSILKLIQRLNSSNKNFKSRYKKLSVLFDALNYLWIGLNQIGSQKLQRVPEPMSVMDDEQSVNDFDQLVKTQTYCMYMYILNLCDRLQSIDCNHKKRALDIACGPGNLSVQLSQILNYEKVWGVDLSEKMLKRANINAQSVKNQVQFLKMNATQLDFEDGFFDLSVFFQSAHHIDSLQEIGNIMHEAERVTKKYGTIIVGDLCRMRTEGNAKRFVKTACSHYLELGLQSLYEDSVNSINAAWTQAELVSAIPQNTNREWYAFKLWPVSAYCFLVSPGKNDKAAFLRKSNLDIKKILPQSLKAEYSQLFLSGQIGEKLREKIK